MPEIDHRLDGIRIEERISPFVLATFFLLLALFGALLVAIGLAAPRDTDGYAPVIVLGATWLFALWMPFRSVIRWTAQFDGRYLTLERRYLLRKEQERIPLADIREVWSEEDKRRVRVQVRERQLELGRRSTPAQRAALHSAIHAALAKPIAVGDASEVPDPLRDLVGQTSHERA